MHEDAIALADAARGKRCRQRRDAAVDLAPGPGSIAVDEADAVAMPAGILGEKMSEVHDPPRHRRDAAARRGGGNRPSHVERSIITLSMRPIFRDGCDCARAFAPTTKLDNQAPRGGRLSV